MYNTKNQYSSLVLQSSSSMENRGSVLHVVMFPWLATGHLIPFLHLSKCLASKGHLISFVSTPRNLQRLPKIPPNLAPLINLVSLPFPRVENLPENAESSMDIPYQKAQLLKIAFDLLQLPLAEFLEKTSPNPDWIVYDYASHWLPNLAANLGNGVSCAYFSLFNAANMAFIGPPSALLNEEYARTTAEDFTVAPSWIPFRSEIVYRVHELMKYMESSEENDSGTSDLERFAVSVRESDVVLFRTCVEFEPEWFNLVSELYNKPVVPVGFLPPPSLIDIEREDDEKWVEMKGWLDRQSVSSVVYVALGTEATLSQDELIGLALGLEQSGLPFLWVLRKPPGSTRNVMEMLPDEFEERVKDRGMVYVDWAPQVKILGHPSVGGFLTHCGWNSVIEALSFGRVLILFPVMNDQGLNARLLQGKKLGLEIPRNEQDGSFTSDSVAESVRLAMVSEKGESLRANAREMEGLFGDKNINDRYIDSFVGYIVERTKHPSQ